VDLESFRDEVISMFSQHVRESVSSMTGRCNLLDIELILGFGLNARCQPISRAVAELRYTDENLFAVCASILEPSRDVGIRLTVTVRVAATREIGA
jgi:hypothetical protein